MPEPRLFTLAEAQALLPTLRRLLARLWSLDRLLFPLGTHLRPVLALAESHNVGGSELTVWWQLSMAWSATAQEFAELGVQVKDLARGLIDFPCRRADGQVVLLCWQAEEDEIGYWHSLEEGFAGRQPLSTLHRWRDPTN